MVFWTLGFPFTTLTTYTLPGLVTANDLLSSQHLHLRISLATIPTVLWVACECRKFMQTRSLQLTTFSALINLGWFLKAALLTAIRNLPTPLTIPQARCVRLTRFRHPLALYLRTLTTAFPGHAVVGQRHSLLKSLHELVEQEMTAELLADVPPLITKPA